MAKTSVDTEKTADPVQYKPRTTDGLGFFPLLMRAWVHSLVVAYSVFRGWPITYEVAIAELQEAKSRMDKVYIPDYGIYTEKTALQIVAMRNKLDFILTEMQSNPGLEVQVQDKHSEALHDLTNMIFALAAHLDYETLGMSPDNSDAGKTL